MERGHKLLLLLVVLLGGGLAATMFSFLGSDPDPVTSLAGGLRASVPDPGPRTSEPIDGRGEELDAEHVEPRAGTTVPFPLEVTLDLIRAKSLLDAEDTAPLGSGAKANLTGVISSAAGTGVRAEVEFIAGANTGRVLECNSEGKFGAGDLYPGLSIVTVRAPGIPGSMREVRLRQGKKSLLNIGYGLPASVYGEVIDIEGEHVAYADVWMDGQKTTTDENGEFHFPSMTSGEVLLIVQKAGYASMRQKYNVAARQTILKGRIPPFVLEPGLSLKVTIQERLGSSEPAQLHLMPLFSGASKMQKERKYPWHLKSPVSIYPGGTVTIDDLPADHFQLYLFHAGATARPATTIVDLSSGKEQHVVLHLEPAPALHGIVMRDGKPVPKARVTFELPDRAQGTMAALGQLPAVLETHVFPNLALQTAFSNAAGKFEFSALEQLAPVRYLTAVGPRGEGWAGRAVHPGDYQVELVLGDAPEQSASFTIETQKRHQGLPVDVRVNGAPLDLTLLNPDEDLTIAGLTPGVWKVSSEWYDQPLWVEREIEIEGGVTWDLLLPEAAIDGYPVEPRIR